MANTTPADVLAFWFGPEALEVRSVMSTDEFMNAGKKMWYFGGKEVDVQSQRFVPAIEAAAEGTLPWDDDDDDANLAKVILFELLKVFIVPSRQTPCRIILKPFQEVVSRPQTC